MRAEAGAYHVPSSSTMLPWLSSARALLTGGVGAARGAPLRAALHTSAAAFAAPRPAVKHTKLKSHSGAKKRFFPVLGSAKGNPVAMKFKRNSSNKQHLNSGMSRVRLHRLNGTKVVSQGPVSRMLRRLLSPSY